MNTRNETWKRAAQVVKALVITLAVAGASGPARAEGEELSFTARAQVSQGLVPAGDGRAPATMRPTEKVTIPNEAASFIARVESSQGIMPREMRSSSPAVGPIAQGEGDSFITRLLASRSAVGNRS